MHTSVTSRSWLNKSRPEQSGLFLFFVKGETKMETINSLQKRIEQLEKDKKHLMNRCFILSKGLLCTFCEFKKECDYEQKLKEPSKKIRNRNKIFD